MLAIALHKRGVWVSGSGFVLAPTINGIIPILPFGEYK